MITENRHSIAGRAVEQGAAGRHGLFTPEIKRQVPFGDLGLNGKNERVAQFPFIVDPVYNASAIGVSPETREIFVQHKVRLDSDLVLVDNFR